MAKNKHKTFNVYGSHNRQKDKTFTVVDVPN